MLALLARPSGIAVGDLKQMAEDAPALRGDTGAAPGARIEELRDALTPLQVPPPTPPHPLLLTTLAATVPPTAASTLVPTPTPYHSPPVPPTGA